MSDRFWNQVKSNYRLGQLIYGKVEHHAPFGLFVNIGDDTVRGLVQITDFVDSGDMTPEMYPDIGSPIGAVVGRCGLYRRRSPSSLVKCKTECVAKSLGSAQSSSDKRTVITSG
jgi:hypothetical protein